MNLEAFFRIIPLCYFCVIYEANDFKNDPG